MSPTANAAASATVWDDVVGQEHAIAQLQAFAREPVHAYLFIGPRGSTKQVAARAFASVLISGSESAEGRDARLVRSGEHPDVREVHRVGATITTEQIREIVRLAAMSPVEGSRQVMILHEFHLLSAIGAAALLKTIEEPAPSTIFVICAEQMTPDLVTIASRCVRVEFRSPEASVIEARLVEEGVEPGVARSAAHASGGDLSRARVLAQDPEVDERRRAFAEVPRRLDGTGSAVMQLAQELFALIDAAGAPLAARQAQEVAALDEQLAQTGERGGGRRQLEDRHRREQRRHRTDELRAGLGAIAATYRDALVEGSVPRPQPVIDAVGRIHAAIAALGRNPNETLLVQALLLDLPSLSG